MKILTQVIVAVLLLLATTWFTEFLVNVLFTAQIITLVFGVAKITFWQAFAIRVLMNMFRDYKLKTNRP
jgi:hypothetical protein